MMSVSSHSQEHEAQKVNVLCRVQINFVSPRQMTGHEV